MMDRFHVVLVEPGDSLNVGAVARAMCNLGFSRLHLVAPRDFDPERARVTARNAVPLLDAMTVHDRFDDAIAPAQDVVGLALRRGENPTRFVTLPAWAQGLPERQGRVTALVFGPEDDDLRDEHLEKCQWVARIPSTVAFPSFNLAQSVLLTLYEVARALPESGATPLPVDAPSANDFLQLDRLLGDVMSASGFVRPGSPAPTPARLRNLFRRLDLDRREMATLVAFVSRVRTALQRGAVQSPGKEGQDGAGAGDVDD